MNVRSNFVLRFLGCSILGCAVLMMVLAQRADEVKETNTRMTVSFAISYLDVQRNQFQQGTFSL